MFRRTTSKDVSISTQKKVYTRWMESQLNIKVKDIISEIRNGQLLYKLAEVLFRTELPFKYDDNVKQRAKQNRIYTLGTIDQILNYLRDNEVKIECGPQDIYSGDVTQIMGLIWTLIQKFQNIQRDSLLKWVHVKLSESNVKVRDFSDSFSDGIVLALLLNHFVKDAIDMDHFRQVKVLEGLKLVFMTAKSYLNIPRILEPADMYPNKPSEKIVMTYVSYFRNLDEEYDPDQYSDQKKKNRTISEKMDRVNRSIAQVIQKPRTASGCVTIDSSELQTLKDEIDRLHTLLAEQEDVIIQQDLLLRRKDKKHQKVQLKLVEAEKTIIKSNQARLLFETSHHMTLEALRISQKNEALLQKKLEEDLLTLLEQQQAKMFELELIKQRAGIYVKTVFDLRTQLREHADLGLPPGPVVSELDLLRKANEELLNRIMAMESEITESTKKTEELYTWLKDMSKDSDTNPVEKLDGIISRVIALTDCYNLLKKDLQHVSGKHGEIVVYVEWLDKELKRERAKRVAYAKKIKAMEMKRDIVTKIGDDVNIQLSELVNSNLKYLDNLNGLLSQLKTTTTTPSSKPAAGGGKQFRSNFPHPELPLPTTPIPGNRVSRPGSSKRPGSTRGSSKRPGSSGNSKRPAPQRPGSSKRPTVKQPKSRPGSSKRPSEANGTIVETSESIDPGPHKEEKDIIEKKRPSGANVGRTQSGPTRGWFPESLILFRTSRPTHTVARRVNSTKIPERRAM